MASKPFDRKELAKQMRRGAVKAMNSVMASCVREAKARVPINTTGNFRRTIRVHKYARATDQRLVSGHWGGYRYIMSKEEFKKRFGRHPVYYLTAASLRYYPKLTARLARTLRLRRKGK